MGWEEERESLQGQENGSMIMEEDSTENSKEEEEEEEGVRNEGERKEKRRKGGGGGSTRSLGSTGISAASQALERLEQHRIKMLSTPLISWARIARAARRGDVVRMTELSNDDLRRRRSG